MNYEVRKIGRAIEDDSRERVVGECSNNRGDNRMIADNPKAALLALNLARAIAMMNYNPSTGVITWKGGLKRKGRTEGASDRQATRAALTDAMGKPFDPVACRAQFEQECG